MRLDGDPRSGRLRLRLQRLTPYTWTELVLLALIALQCARLVWVMLTPLGPVGDWKAVSTVAAPADPALLTSFDPFFRLDAQSGPAVVTSLNLKLYGVREDRATGHGSAIIALPDGRQMSFSVGEEVMPGVTLTAVGFDNVTISHNGAAEQIFLDQSPAATVVGGTAPPSAAGGATAVPVPPPLPVVVATPAAPPLNFQPRLSGSRVTGIVVTPGGDAQAFNAMGFQPGDVIVAINGERIGSLEQARAAMSAAGNEVSVMVDRGGQAVPLRVRIRS